MAGLGPGPGRQGVARRPGPGGRLAAAVAAAADLWSGRCSAPRLCAACTGWSFSRRHQALRSRPASAVGEVAELPSQFRMACVRPAHARARPTLLRPSPLWRAPSMTTLISLDPNIPSKSFLNVFPISSRLGRLSGPARAFSTPMRGSPPRLITDPGRAEPRNCKLLTLSCRPGPVAGAPQWCGTRARSHRALDGAAWIVHLQAGAQAEAAALCLLRSPARLPPILWRSFQTCSL